MFFSASEAISPILRWVQTPVITNSVCNLMFFGSISDIHICTAGTGGKSTCNVSILKSSFIKT